MIWNFVFSHFKRCSTTWRSQFLIKMSGKNTDFFTDRGYDYFLTGWQHCICNWKYRTFYFSRLVEFFHLLYRLYAAKFKSHLGLWIKKFNFYIPLKCAVFFLSFFLLYIAHMKFSEFALISRKYWLSHRRISYLANAYRIARLYIS